MPSIRPAVTVALACAAAGASAQTSSVTLYGLIDIAVERLTNATPAGASVVRMPSQGAGQLPSRWGLRGSEDLGNGLKANFTLESGFAPDKGTSNQGGRLFGRQAWVGLSGGWGAVSLGRQYSRYFYSFGDDPIGAATMGIGAFDGYTAAARSDNTIAYQGTFGGLTAGATYSLGRDAATSSTCAGEVAGDAQACRLYSVSARWDSSTWGAGAVREQQRGGPGGAAGLNSSALTDTRHHVHGYVKLGSLKWNAGIVQRNQEGTSSAALTPKTQILYTGLSYPITPTLSVDGFLGQIKWKDSSDGSKATQAVVRLNQALSKRSQVYVMAGRMNNHASANLSLSAGTLIATEQDTRPGAGRGQSGLAVGMRHNF